MVSPLIHHLLLTLPRFLLQAGVVYAGFYSLQGNYSIPVWLALTLSALSVPAYSTIHSLLRDYQYLRDAAANGALPIPVIPISSWKAMNAMRKSYIFSPTPIKIHEDWVSLYGNTFRMPSIGPDVMVFTAEPSHIKAILATQFDKFGKGPELKDQDAALFGRGIFNSDGEMWKYAALKSLHTHGENYHADASIGFIENFENHTSTAISLMKQRFSEGLPVDFQDAIGRFALDTATVHLFGHDMHSLDAGLPFPPEITNADIFKAHSSNAFMHAFAEGQLKSASRIRIGTLWRMFEPWRDEVMYYRATMNEYIQPLIEEAVRKREGKDAVDQEDENETLLDHMLRDSHDETLLQDQLINMLVAGRDTTAGTLSWAVYMLAEHPEIARRLREEIVTQVGLERQPTYPDLRSMKYLRAFVNETLRLFPSVPVNFRYADKPALFPSENGAPAAYVREGTTVTYSTFIMHRRTDLWGPDARQFDPDRFLDSRLKTYLIPNPFIFVPFSAGPRICPGQQFAYNEMEYFLVRLLQTFSEFSIDWKTQPESSKTPASWIPTDEPENIGYEVGLTMSVKGALWVKMKETI